MCCAGPRAGPTSNHRVDAARSTAGLMNSIGKSETLYAMQAINRRGLLRLGAGLSLAAVAPPVLSAAGRMRFSKYEIFPTSVPMAERVREAWTESYQLQGTFQTHYSAVF